MPTDDDSADKSRSQRLLEKRTQCFDHARDLIEAAERVLDSPKPMPNIAFHLVLLAIEEMGKAGLIASREAGVGHRDTAWVDKRLDDHAFKILWGLWTPFFDAAEDFGPDRFQQLKSFSQKAHLQRLAALYVDGGLYDDATSTPRDAVQLNDVQALLKTAKANLVYLSSRGSPDVDMDDDLTEWFWETISEDLGQKRLFSAPFIAKYADLRDDPREWIRWARSEFSRIKQEEDNLLQAELARIPEQGVQPTPRWRVKMRVYCVSHSLRPKILNLWNQRVPLANLRFVNSGELLLEITLGDHVNISNLPGAAISLSKLIIACLNIGTAGFFWYETPAPLAKLFEKIDDLINPGMKVDVSGGQDFRRHFLSGEGKRKLTVLEEHNLLHAARCAVIFGAMPDSETAPILAPYLAGLVFMGKSDTHLALDTHAVGSFHTSLTNALKHFGDWNGDQAQLVPTLHGVFEHLITEADHRNMLFEHLTTPPKSLAELQDLAISAKRLVDLYLTIVAKRIWKERFASGD